MMKTSAVMLLFVMWGLLGCAQQQKNTTPVAKGFYKINMPGNIPVDEHGNAMHGPDTVVSFIVETQEDSINWSHAQYNGKLYSLVAEKLPGGKATIGSAGSADVHEIACAPGNILWQLYITPAVPVKGSLEKLEAGKALLKGKKGSKSVKIVVPDLVQLPPDIHY